MPMEPPYDVAEHPWAAAAKHYLEQALDEVESGNEAFFNISAAEACLLIEAGELEPEPDLLEAAQEGP